MNFSSDSKFVERLAILANTFRYRLGGMALLATLFLTKENPYFRFFGVIIFIWIAVETLNKLYIGRSQKAHDCD